MSPDLLERQGFAESSWNPEALGPMTKYGQARGLAQFIPGTGKAYGLLTDSDFHDPQKAIPAQARYMADLKKRFGGSDELALAAYNMGPTALQRKLDKAGASSRTQRSLRKPVGIYRRSLRESNQAGHQTALDRSAASTLGPHRLPQKVPLIGSPQQPL